MQGWIPLRLVKQEGRGMAEHFPQQAVDQMPGIPGPYLFSLEALNQLAEDGVDAIADATEEALLPRQGSRLSDWKDACNCTPLLHSSSAGGSPEAPVPYQNTLGPSVR